jgi:glycerate 2-kinase
MNQNTTLEKISEIFAAALDAVSSYNAAAAHCADILSSLEKDYMNRLLVIGFGKAACQMAKAVEDNMAPLIRDGIVVTKYGHCPSGYQSGKIRIFEAGHPMPDENGLHGTEAIIGLLRNADENTLVVCLISGGGSALLAAPYGEISLSEKQKVTELLLRAGADIRELNTVRKHISRVKGGRLAAIASPAHIFSLILSDVIGDRLDVIASGPTAPDTTTYNDAAEILKKYGLMGDVPESVSNVLMKGADGLLPETPKENDTLFQKVRNVIIGSNGKALEAAKIKSEYLGFTSEVISSEIAGEAREVGRWLARKALEIQAGGHGGKPACIISGGETTVTVKGDGTGGRNMELALAFALEIEGARGITLLSAGTDGTDGPTDAAGAVVDGQTIEKARGRGLDARRYLKNNDSYNFFREIDCLFMTGPTGTNVMDVQVLVVE